MSGSVQLEADPAGQQGEAELIQAHALPLRLGHELLVQGDGETKKELSAGFHAANSTAYGIDNGSTAEDTTPMTKRTITVRMEIEIDDAAWASEYGTPISSIEDYILNQIWGSPAAEAGAIAPAGYVVEGL
jgi:hypothetical protein